MFGPAGEPTMPRVPTGGDSPDDWQPLAIGDCYVLKRWLAGTEAELGRLGDEQRGLRHMERHRERHMQFCVGTY